jgi:hypothetical protein
MSLVEQEEVRPGRRETTLGIMEEGPFAEEGAMAKEGWLAAQQRLQSIPMTQTTKTATTPAMKCHGMTFMPVHAIAGIIVPPWWCRIHCRLTLLPSTSSLPLRRRRR